MLGEDINMFGDLVGRSLCFQALPGEEVCLTGLLPGEGLY